MKVLRTLSLCIALTGCVTDVDESLVGLDDIEFDEDHSEESVVNTSDDNGNSGCGYEVIETPGPTDAVYLIIPLECDPYWMYRTPPGDPSHDTGSQQDDHEVPSDDGILVPDVSDR